MGFEIVDGFVLYLIFIIGGLMIVSGNLLVMVILVGILGNIVVVLFRGIIILYVSVVYVGWVWFEVIKYGILIWVWEVIIVLEFELFYIESVVMGNIVIWFLVVVVDYLINENYDLLCENLKFSCKI